MTVDNARRRWSFITIKQVIGGRHAGSRLHRRARHRPVPPLLRRRAGRAGYTCLSTGDDSLGYGAAAPALWISATEHPVPADTRSGLHICFAAPSRDAVDAFHAAALRNGGQDNGAPGLRPAYSGAYYAAFVIDPDGYRIEAHCDVA